jgi:ribosomal protein L11 methyltransferase
MSWLQIKFTTTIEQQESLEDALLAAGAVSITYQDAADQPILEPGLNETPLWQELLLIALLPADINSKETLAVVAEHFNSELPSHRVEILEDKDWVRQWMDSYQPLQFAQNLWICPSWKEPVDPNAVNILLDPGLAFGTGTHPTTAMCLRQLAAMDLQGKTIIDYGTGSGILAIAALLLGAKSVVATDIDPQALSATKENAQRNGISAEQLSCYLAGEEPNEPADIVIANILAGPLVELAPSLSKLCVAGGELLLSGLLIEQQTAIETGYPAFKLHTRHTEQEWLCLYGNKLA